jgi:hypothetical protein
VIPGVRRSTHGATLCLSPLDSGRRAGPGAEHGSKPGAPGTGTPARQTEVARLQKRENPLRERYRRRSLFHDPHQPEQRRALQSHPRSPRTASSPESCACIRTCPAQCPAFEALSDVRPVLETCVAMAAVTVRGLLTAGLAALALLPAGCGGSKAPSVASLRTTTSSAGRTTTSAATPSRAAFAACLTSHGFQAAPGSAATAANDAISVGGVVISGNVDPSSPQFQAAMQACHKFLPGGGPPAMTPAQRAEHAKSMASFAACMRKHGVPSFPDPNGQGMFSPGSIKGLDPSAPVFQSAFKLCAPLQGKVGPRIQFGP